MDIYSDTEIDENSNRILDSACIKCNKDYEKKCTKDTIKKVLCKYISDDLLVKLLEEFDIEN